jgi:hypothetical protein
MVNWAPDGMLEFILSESIAVTLLAPSGSPASGCPRAGETTKLKAKINNNAFDQQSILQSPEKYWTDRFFF